MQRAVAHFSETYLPFAFPRPVGDPPAGGVPAQRSPHAVDEAPTTTGHTGSGWSGPRTVRVRSAAASPRGPVAARPLRRMPRHASGHVADHASGHVATGTEAATPDRTAHQPTTGAERPAEGFLRQQRLRGGPGRRHGRRPAIPSPTPRGASTRATRPPARAPRASRTSRRVVTRVPAPPPSSSRRARRRTTPAPTRASSVGDRARAPGRAPARARSRTPPRSRATTGRAGRRRRPGAGRRPTVRPPTPGDDTIPECLSSAAVSRPSSVGPTPASRP